MFFDQKIRAAKTKTSHRKQTGSNVSVLLNKVSALEHDRFMLGSLCTVSHDYLKILYFSKIPKILICVRERQLAFYKS